MSNEAPTPRLSVIVPCYNVEQYLPACLDSLLAQEGFDDYEIICVNDGTPDNSVAIMAQYAAQHPHKVRYVERENGGLWLARWTGIDVARGEYLAFVDADDTVTSDFCATLYNTAHEADADICVCGFSRTDLDTGKVLSREMCDAKPPFTLAGDPGRIVEVNPAVWNKCFRARCVQAMHRLQNIPAILEDLAFDLLFYLVSQQQIVFAPHSCVNYMVHADSMINTVRPDQVESVKRMLLEIRGYYEQDRAPRELMVALDALAFLHLGVSMSYRLSSSPDVDLGQAMAQTTAYLNEHFPTWRRNPYITARYARGRGGAFTKLLISQWMYKLHLMRPFLATYRFMIERLHVDIKW